MQRVVKATVRVENQTVGAIAQGLCVFVGVTHEDSFEESDQLVKKIVSLRIMDDENKKVSPENWERWLSKCLFFQLSCLLCGEMTRF